MSPARLFRRRSRRQGTTTSGPPSTPVCGEVSAHVAQIHEVELIDSKSSDSCTRRLASVLGLMRFVISSDTQDTLLEGLPHQMADLIDVDVCHVLRYDDEKGILNLMGPGYFKMEVSDSITSAAVLLPVDGSLSGMAILQGRPVSKYYLLEGSSGFWWQEFLDETGCQSMISVPIPDATPAEAESSDKSRVPIGCINLYSRDAARVFSQEEELLACSVAVSVGQKLVNLRERAEAYASRETLETCTRNLRSAETLDALAGFATRCTQTLASDIWLWDGKKLILGGTTGLTTKDRAPLTPAHYNDAYYELGEGITGFVAQTRRSIRIINRNDLASAIGSRPGLTNSIKFLHPQLPNEVERLNVLIHPICHGNELLGVIRILGKQDNRPVSKHDQAVLEIIARQLGACLFADAQARAREDQAIKERKEAILRNDEFMATVSHQLRAPLAAMQSHCRDLMNQPLMTQDRWLKVRQTLDTWCELAANIAYNFSSVRKILDNPDSFTISPARYSLVGMLIRAAALHQPSGWARKVKIHVREEDFAGLPFVEVDEALMIQAFMNLLDNAVKYSAPGTDVWVTLPERQQSSYTICVENVGVPILPEECERIFEKEYRTPLAEVVNPVGTGLGLPIARTIAQLHGGNVSVTSKPDGSTLGFHRNEFHITLPFILRRDRERNT
jgi:signal transduction histidine kinase